MEDLDLRSIADARRLVEAASGAAPSLANLTQESIDAIVDAVHEAAVPRAAEWARLAVEETGFGNETDKKAKNLFAAETVYRHIRPMRTVGVLSRDDEARVIEIAAPAGIVAAIIPCTNPTSTAINKILIALKAACPIVISPHPSASRCVAEVVRVLSAAAEGAGAPEGSIGCMTDVALAGTRELMRHPRTGVILATGGTGLVRAAYSSGKPAYGVGPGNVPSYVDRSADLAKAARDIVNGKSFDHGVLCSAENAVVADAPVAGALRAAMISEGAFFLDAEQTRRLSALAVTPAGSLNTAIVGKSAEVIASLAGIEAPPGTRCLVAPLDAVGPSAPLSREKLSPILAFYVEDGWERGCARCLEVLEYGGMGHTLSIHATDRDLILRFGLTKPVFRIVVNSPAAIGAVGLTTGVAPSMTLG
ncbi:MAG TPA: aldehyde dehydrogenase family protein, partial [Candidatus Saccharimonadales bacterium]|nr:aldehyde dehydrogenase family protein [Candidatus Saccharimonadales bacterium]